MFGLHHEALIAALQRVSDGTLTRLMIFMPPRHGKSHTTSELFPAYYLGEHPHHHIIGASHGDSLAHDFGGAVRRQLDDEAWPFADVRPAGRAPVAGNWRIKEHGGRFLAAGRGGAIIGRGAHLLLIDDPLKNQQEADSSEIRQSLWDWYEGTARRRVENELTDPVTGQQRRGAIILIQCMTGETPVRMSDGAERPLRDIRPGDHVATYRHGILAASTVLRHASQGYDNIYRIMTTSGRIVYANERHPFLVEEHGQRQWMRLRDLTTAHKIVTVRASGGSGAVLLAPLRDATSQRSAGDFAHLTTQSRCGPPGIAPLPSIQRRIASAISSIGTASLPPNMTRSWPRRAVRVPSASSLPRRRIPALIGARSFAWTTATKPGRCGDFSATTVTLPWAMRSRQQQRAQWPHTSDFTTERIASIEPAGVAEVFDVQIADTENFIANGLVSHNTRWHEDDLAGRLLRQADQNPAADQWEVLSLPAIAEPGDPLGRAEGAVLWPEKYSAEEIYATRASTAARIWSAQYQQRPLDAGARLFHDRWMQHRYTLRVLPVYRRIVQVCDAAWKLGVQNSYSVIATWGLTESSYDLLDLWRDRVGYPTLLATLRDTYHKWRPYGCDGLYIEDAASGTSALQSLAEESDSRPPVNAIPFAVGGIQQYSFVESATPFFAAARVRLPESAPWLADWIREHIGYPTEPHDDTVITTAMALRILSGEPPTRQARQDFSGFGRGGGRGLTPAERAGQNGHEGRQLVGLSGFGRAVRQAKQGRDAHE